MINEPSIDPLFEALSGVGPVGPRQFVDRRIRRRCHAVLADRRARGDASAKSVRMADIAGAAAVTLYVVAIVTEAVRLWP